MMRRHLKPAVLAAVLLAGCADEEAKDQASAAEQAAESARARAEEAEMRLEDLETRVQNLESEASY